MLRGALVIAAASALAPASAQAPDAERISIRRPTALRDGPADGASTVSTLPARAVLARLPERLGPWIHVRTRQGDTGWIHLFDIGNANPAVLGGAAGTALRDLSRVFTREADQSPEVQVATSTLGFRSVGRTDLATARPEPLAVQRAEALRVDAAQADAFAAAAGLVARAVADLPADVPSPAEAPDDAQEAALGRQLAALLLGSKPLHPDRSVQRYVNQLGRWISLQSARPALPWTFAVLDDEGFGAFSAPGGYVFVTHGLLARVNDEAELAGLLAREISHVVARHQLQAMRRDPRADQVLAVGRAIYTRGLDPRDELEADRMAVVLAARAGLDPWGLVSVLQQLQTVAPGDAAFAPALAAQPSFEVRLDRLELAMARRMDGAAGGPPATVAQRVAQSAAAAARAPTGP